MKKNEKNNDKILAKLTNQKNKRTQINKTINERGNIKIDTTVM